MRLRNQKARVRYQKLGKEKVKAPVCPYCGRVSVLRPAEYVHGEKNINPGENLYVCSGYPECDAYVGVVRGSRKAKGTLADGELRHKRILAHRLLNQITEQGIMDRDAVYQWLAIRLGLSYEDTHIGYFSADLCDKAIELMQVRLKSIGAKKAA